MENLAAFLKSLPPGPLDRCHLLTSETLIARQGNLSAYYIPFGYYPPDAKIALVGITPGFQQMRLAYEAARVCQDQGDELLRACQLAAGFGGPMRRILVSMLDGLGLDFDSALKDSVLRHPVFVDGAKNYTGHHPPLVRSTFLMDLASTYFAPSIAARPNVLIVPMGKAVESALRALNLPNAVLSGFSHPSPASGHRQRQYLSNLESMWRQLASWSGK
jgi:hypothetical protein